MRGPRSLADLLLSSGQLQRLRAEASKRRQLTERVQGLLPTAEAQHLLSAHMSERDELVLVLDSPAWAARARYLQDDLRKGLKPLLIKRMRVQARPRR